MGLRVMVGNDNSVSCDKTRKEKIKQQTSHANQGKTRRGKIKKDMYREDNEEEVRVRVRMSIRVRVRSMVRVTVARKDKGEIRAKGGVSGCG